MYLDDENASRNAHVKQTSSGKRGHSSWQQKCLHGFWCATLPMEPPFCMSSVMIVGEVLRRLPRGLAVSKRLMYSAGSTVHASR